MDNKDSRDLDRDTLDSRDRHDSTAKDFVTHENSKGETVAGSVGGAAVGAAWGTLAGPLGTIIGGLAGAVGGWWAARSATEQHLFNLDDDGYYREHHKTQGATAKLPSGRDYSYDDVRPAYQVGHLAGTNPDYSNKSFDDVEPHLRSAYGTAGQDNWDDVRGYARDAYSRGRTVGSERGMSTGLGTNSMTEGMTGSIGTGSGAAGASGTGGSGAMGGTSDMTGMGGIGMGGVGMGGMGGSAGVGGSAGTSSGTSGSGGSGGMSGSSGSTSGSTGGMGSATTDTEHSLRGKAAGLVDRIADAADDLKDRVDGNPASRPGRDETDRPGR